MVSALCWTASQMCIRDRAEKLRKITFLQTKQYNSQGHTGNKKNTDHGILTHTAPLADITDQQSKRDTKDPSGIKGVNTG